jgi:hypothetical protein
MVGNLKNALHVSVLVSWATEKSTVGLGRERRSKRSGGFGMTTAFLRTIRTPKTCIERQLTAQRHKQGHCPCGYSRPEILCEKGVSSFSAAIVAQQHRHLQAIPGSGRYPSSKD